MLLLIMIEKCPITKKKRVIMSFLSRSLSGFSCTRAWAVGHTSPESGWPVWRRAPTRPGCCPRNGAGECQILDILNESFPRGLNMKCHEMGSMFGFMIEWLLPYPTKYHEMDFQDYNLNQHNCPAKKVEPGEPAIASAGLSVERAQQPLQPAVTVIRGI